MTLQRALVTTLFCFFFFFRAISSFFLPGFPRLRTTFILFYLFVCFVCLCVCLFVSVCLSSCRWLKRINIGNYDVYVGCCHDQNHSFWAFGSAAIYQIRFDPHCHLPFDHFPIIFVAAHQSAPRYPFFLILYLPQGNERVDPAPYYYLLLRIQ